jgi:hypothetical protein
MQCPKTLEIRCQKPEKKGGGNFVLAAAFKDSWFLAGSIS